MSAIVGTSAVAVYKVFSSSLEKQLNQELQGLAQAAVPSLTTVKTSSFQALDKDLPWRDLLEDDQGLEWFDSNCKLLAKKGTTLPNIPLPKDFCGSHLSSNSQFIQKHYSIHSLSIAVYAENLEQKTLRLEGYIRVSESIDEWQLHKLRWGLEIGGIIALTLISITSMGLTWFVQKPMSQSLQNLKEFSADVAHELRSPLTAITTAIEVMQINPERLSAADAKKLGIIASATDQIVRLVEDLRFLTQTDAIMNSSHIVEHSPIHLDELLEDLVERFAPQAESKEIQFESHIKPGISVQGDIDQLSRLFCNLLENALKYTAAEGKVTLFLEQHRKFALVRVEDTGIGIPQEYLRFIFQRFWRANKARSQQKDGLGLGLAICQNIAHRHRGKIKVTSKVGVGSSFQVYLPLLQFFRESQT
jgi:signal transduction histidine kinase